MKKKIQSILILLTVCFFIACGNNSNQENINDKFDNPEFKKELSESIDNAADVAEITIKAMDKPIDAAIVKLNDAGTKAASGIGAGAIKVGTDMLGAIPGFGAIIDLGKIINACNHNIFPLAFFQIILEIT